MENKFNEEDKSKFVQFMNYVAQNAKFELDTKQVIEYYSLLTHMQKIMLPKIDSNILEITKVVEAKDSDATAS